MKGSWGNLNSEIKIIIGYTADLGVDPKTVSDITESTEMFPQNSLEIDHGKN
jgi:hypothetical protein